MMLSSWQCVRVLRGCHSGPPAWAAACVRALYLSVCVVTIRAAAACDATHVQQHRLPHVCIGSARSAPGEDEACLPDQLRVPVCGTRTLKCTARAADLVLMPTTAAICGRSDGTKCAAPERMRLRPV